MQHFLYGMVTAGMIAVGLATSSAQAAPTLSPVFTTDAAYQAYLLGNTELAVAQGRIGNGAANGDYELGLHTAPSFAGGAPIAGTTQYAWVNGSPVSFSLVRASNALTFTMGNYVATYTDAVVATINVLAFRTAANAVSTATLSNLLFNSVALGPSISATGGGRTIQVLEQIAGGNFTLSGDLTLSWTGTRPNGSNLATQIKAYNDPTPVPEPASAALLLSGIAAMVGLRRRRQTA